MIKKVGSPIVDGGARKGAARWIADNADPARDFRTFHRRLLRSPRAEDRKRLKQLSIDESLTRSVVCE